MEGGEEKRRSIKSGKRLNLVLVHDPIPRRRHTLLTNHHWLLPVSQQGLEFLQHLGMHLQDRRDIAKNDLQLRLVQELLHLGIFLKGSLEHVHDRAKNIDKILFGLGKLGEDLLPGGHGLRVSFRRGSIVRNWREIKGR